MIGPGRVAGPDASVRFGGLDQVGRDAQGAGAAGGLHGADPVLFPHAARAAEDQLLHGAVEAGHPARAQVGLAGLAAVQDPFRFEHAVQNRRIAVFVPVDADTEIDFFRIGVGGVGGDDAEDGVGGYGLEAVKHGWFSCRFPKADCRL